MSEKGDDKIEVEAGPKGGKISVSGDGTSRLIHAAADIISPASQGLGAIGDAIEQFRVHRRERAAITLERVKEIKRQRGETIEQISPKTLSPWIEGASAEESGPNNISEIWARILAGSHSNFDSNVAAYIDICRRIGRSEAEQVFELVDAHHLGQFPNRQGLIYSFTEDIAAGSMEQIKKCVTLNDGVPRIDYNNSKFSTISPPKGAGVIPLDVFISGRSNGQSHSFASEKSVTGILILQREGLADVRTRTYREDDLTINYRYATGTMLAYSFLEHLYPDGLPDSSNLGE